MLVHKAALAKWKNTSSSERSRPHAKAHSLGTRGWAEFSACAGSFVGAQRHLQSHVQWPSAFQFQDNFRLVVCGRGPYVCVLVTQLCLTLWDPVDCTPPGSPVHGILQATTLEQVPIPFSRGIFPTQGLTPGVLHCRQIPYHLSHQRSPSGPYAAAKSLQLCPTLCDPMHCSLPGFSVRGILQARTLEWVAISFSNAWKWKVKMKSLSRFQLLATPWTAAYQASPSMGFSRQQYWSEVPLPSPREALGVLKTRVKCNDVL